MLYIQKMRDDSSIRTSLEGKTTSERFIHADFNDEVKEILSRFFAKYSERFSNVISHKGFATVIYDVGLKCDDKKISEIFHKADKDNNGTIDKQEFFDVIKE